MRLKECWMIFLIGAGGAILFWWSSRDHTPQFVPRYRAFTIPDEEHQWTSAKAINNLGQIAGTVQFRKWQVCALWDPNKGTTLVGPIRDNWGSSEFFATSPERLNEEGQILGMGSIIKGSVSFLGEPDGDYRELSTSGYSGLNRAIDLNSTGHVAGYISSSSGYSAVIWDASFQYRKIPVKDNSYAVGINDRNVICGWESSAFFIYDGTDVTRHPEVPAGAHVSEFSNGSHVSGFFSEERGLVPQSITSGFIWSPTQGIVIDSASAERQSMVLGINVSGEAVGAVYPMQATLARLKDFLWKREVVWIGYTPPDPNLDHAEAVVWEDGNAIPLKELIEGDSPFDRLKFANDINDDGVIVGTGEIKGRSEAFILKPLERVSN